MMPLLQPKRGWGRLSRLEVRLSSMTLGQSPGFRLNRSGRNVRSKSINVDLVQELRVSSIKEVILQETDTRERELKIGDGDFGERLSAGDSQ